MKMTDEHDKFLNQYMALSSLNLITEDQSKLFEEYTTLWLTNRINDEKGIFDIVDMVKSDLEAIQKEANQLAYNSNPPQLEFLPVHWWD